MVEKYIKRGYVKWTDEDGTFHKEPLADHPDLLEEATPQQQIQAEEAHRLNAAAVESQKDDSEEQEQDAWDTLHALQSAPASVLTTADLVVADDDKGNEIIKPAPEIVSSTDLENVPPVVVVQAPEVADGNSNNNADHTE